MLSIVVRVVNFIRDQALNHRLFRVFWNNVFGSTHALFHHREVALLSLGRVLTRVFELRREIEQFLRQRSNTMKEVEATASYASPNIHP